MNTSFFHIVIEVFKIVTKGQLISKSIYGLLTSPKKRTDNLFCLLFYSLRQTNQIRLSAFRFYLTYTHHPRFSDLLQSLSLLPNTCTVVQGLFKKETISKLPSTKIHCISHQLQNLKIQCMKRSKIESLSISTLVTESKDSRAVLYFNIYDIHLLSTSIGLTSKKIL